MNAAAEGMHDRHVPGHLLLITGRPGIGKTTVIRRVASSLRSTAPAGGARLSGCYTQEVRVGAVRQGFRLVTFDAQEALMAHVDGPTRPRVGRYGVDVALIDRVAEDTLAPRPGVDVYLVDEIGKMECLSTRFVAAMRRLLSLPHPVVATVGQRGSGFIAEVKSRLDGEVWTVTLANRDGLPARVLEWLGAVLPRV
jgi:nucleoside-triphosphatase